MELAAKLSPIIESPEGQDTRFSIGKVLKLWDPRQLKSPQRFN
jgi:hypothetical protein